LLGTINKQASAPKASKEFLVWRTFVYFSGQQADMQMHASALYLFENGFIPT